MDSLLKQLDVSADGNLTELVPQFARVLSSIHTDSYLELDASQIRTILRAVLFLHGNLQVHGINLETKLKESPLIPKTDLATMLSKFHSGRLLSDICEQLLLTVTGPDHILEIQEFCNSFLDSNDFIKILTNARKIRNSEMKEDLVFRETQFLISTTFRLQSRVAIKQAIEGIINRVQFDILASIIKSSDSSTYFGLKCLIVLSELCSQLENGHVDTHLIASMFETCALDEEGMSLYFKCLQNLSFANSLMAFLIKYINATEDKFRGNEQLAFRHYDANHMSFLIAGVMSQRSHCRIEFHKKIAALSGDVSLLQSISKLNFVYSF